MRVRCTCGRARCARTVQLSWFAATLSCHQGLLDALYALEVQRQAEETRGTSGVGQAAGAEPGVAQGLLEAHAQLQQLQGRVCDTLAVMSSKDMPREAGLLAEDGTLDRAAGLGAMVQLQDTLEGAWACCG